MPIVRRLVAQDDNDENQWLKVDHNKRYVVNDMDDWQFIFGPNSSLSTSQQVVKISAEFDAENIDRIRFTGYLYNLVSGSIDGASSCVFKLYLVTQPGWFETLVTTFNGTVQVNSQFFADLLLSSVPSINFFGDSTIAIECVITRLSETYREKVYVNHLGIYDNVFRLRKEVDYLTITKLDE